MLLAKSSQTLSWKICETLDIFLNDLPNMCETTGISWNKMPSCEYTASLFNCSLVFVCPTEKQKKDYITSAWYSLIKSKVVTLSNDQWWQTRVTIESEKETDPSKLSQRLLGLLLGKVKILANSWPACPQQRSHNWLRDTFRLQFLSRFWTGE